MAASVRTIYASLLSSYGPQGWWPLSSHEGTNPTKTGSSRGYHPGDYSLPKTSSERFEVCAGAILTQNSSWPNAEKAINNLAEASALSPEKIIELPALELAALIKPSGYFNQKARKLQGFARFYLYLGGRTPKRAELLALWGIGPETADSILLYAYHSPEFVVDAYTKRIASRLGLAKETSSYDEVKAVFVDGLPTRFEYYNECHALLVEHAKRHCLTSEPRCAICPLKRVCAFGRNR